VITIVRDPVVAEDVAQVPFARAWRYAAGYDARRGSVSTWLLTIARNESIEALRLRLVEPADPEAVIAELDGSQARGEGEDSSPELGERERHVRRCSVVPPVRGAIGLSSRSRRWNPLCPAWFRRCPGRHR
jgi:DNA-directed RNA polymerase specialized sigma24 family protein